MLMRGILVKCCVTVGLLQTILCVGQSVNADSISPPIGDSKIGLECSARGIDNEMMHLLDVMPLFELAEPTVIQPIDMSADYPGMTLKSYGVKLPKQLYTADTNAQGQPFKLKANLVYGFAQHVHGIGVLPNHTLLVVERPQVMKYRKSRIWVDINHNLDLTDDPIQFYTPSSVAFSLGVVPESGSVIKLDNNEWGVALQLGFFLGGELRSYQKLYSDAVDLVKADRKFIGVSNSFRQRRMTVIYGSNVYQNDTLFWALKDVNVNGTYNDIGVDMIMVSNDHGLFNTANAWKLVKGKTILDWLGQGWRAQVWNKLPGLGSAEWGLTLEPINSNQVKNARSLLIGNKLPKFRFCVIEGAYKVGKLKENPVHRRSIRKFKGKYTVLLVWNADDSLYHKDSAIYHEISRQLPENVQMIMLNHGGSGRYVYGYNRRFDTKMIHGFCSPQVTEMLKLQTMPQLFLLDPKQRLIDINMSAFELIVRINATLR
jgi:hypothetical protein